MPEMAARTLRLCLPLQKIPREARLLQEARFSIDLNNKEVNSDALLVDKSLEGTSAATCSILESG
jgi:hypothetical protein